MANQQYDIFTGGRVELAVSTHLDDAINFHDHSFIVVPNVIAFPDIGFTREIATFETYDSDAESKLAGGKSYDNTEITVAVTDGDPTADILEAAFENKTELRFRFFYVMDTVKGSGTMGYYKMFDGYVLGIAETGDIDAVVQKTYTIDINKMLDSGVARLGEPVLTGMFGIGAGTADYPGAVDWAKLSGNRFVTFPGSSSHNPFGSDTGGIGVQGNDNQGWQLVVNSSGDKPLIRARTLNATRQNPWVKVYSDVDKPTPKDINAVNIAGDNMTGKLFTPEIKATNILFSPAPGQETEAGNKRYIQTVNKAGGAVTIASMWHSGGKGFTEIDNINATNTLRDRGQMVYSPLNIPTPHVIGALPIRGGKLTGDLDAPYISVHAPSLPTFALFSTDATIPTDRNLTCLTQSTNGDFRLIYRNSVTNVILSGITFEAGKSGSVYHTGNKPTAADIGAIDHNDIIDLGVF